MKTIKRIVALITPIPLTCAIYAQTSSFDTTGLQLVPSDQLPPFGTFWVQGPTGPMAPWPYPPPATSAAPTYALPNGQFLVDTTAAQGSAITSSTTDIPLPGDGGSSDGGSPPPPPPPDTANLQKFMAQTFLLVDTNDAAFNDTNLYAACIAFAADTNTSPDLQIAHYSTNALIIKANHFDYSAETTRDFALLICDKVETPVWKTISLSNPPNGQDGWLIQGLVPNWTVTDPMFMMVSNINLAYNGFFRAAPYGGPRVALTGPSPYATVSNTITLTAAVSDLTGTTSQQLAVAVNGLPARYTLGPNNTISVDTRYAPNGSEEVEVTVANSTALVFDPNNPTFDTKRFYTTTATIPLDFENDTYLLSAADLSSPTIGTNYIFFVVDKAQQIQATIFDPSNNQAVASYGGYVPYPATVVIPWNFTEADNVTPYSNETYGVTFTASGPTTLSFTNRIERYGVRQAAGCIVTYEEEDPNLSAGPYLNSEANKWITAVAASYESLCYWDFGSLTQYAPTDIGPGRDNPPYEFPYVLTGNFQLPWAAKVFSALTNLMYSDFGYYTGHGNGTGLGGHASGSTFVTGFIDTTTTYPYVHTSVPNWRMRKVAIWACYSDATPDLTAQGTIKSWAETFGIRRTWEQTGNMVTKNVGLFFTGELPQGGYSGTYGHTCAEVAAMFDDLWVTGPTPAPGSCNPTYAFSWAVSQIRGIAPELEKGKPTWIGFGYLPYTGIYDAELLTNNVSHISR